MKNIRFIFFLILITSLNAQENYPVKRSYIAKKTNPKPPTIDGRANDLVWKSASCGGQFIQSEPQEGTDPSQNTEFRICYDEKNLFVLIQAFDTEPEKIISRLARRDEIDHSDAVGIFIDSYFDRRTSFEFAVNVKGVKYDAVNANDDLSNSDKNWDPVWDVATSINDSGWIAEMRIPFSQLRFPAKEEQIWGLEIYRYLHRKEETSIWQFMSRNAAGFVSNFGQLKGIRDIAIPRRVEILPYTVSKSQTYEPEDGNPFSTGKNSSFSGGLDGKIGLSSDMTADFTFNPDFGQVEADPSEVNLTAFETFFEEKRPFFMEGKNIYQFALGIGDGDFARETLFYSRRIGRIPQHEPDLADQEYINTLPQTSIIGAAKISGKTSGGWSLGILDAVTAEEIARIDSLGVRRKVTVEPFTNYFIGRLQKDFNEGNTYFGSMVTSTNRNIEQSYLDYINRSAYTAGIDFIHQWSNKTYFTEVKLAASHIRGHQEAITEAQTSSARYFQRPDANYLRLDSSRTSMSGHGGSVNVGKQGNGKLRYILGGIWRSPGLELNDVGYLQKADQAMQYIWIGYQMVDPTWIFQQLNINLNQWNGWNFGGEKIFMGGNINGGGQFKNYWDIYLGVNRENSGITTSYLRGGPAVRYEGGWNDWYHIYSDSRKNWQIRMNGNDSWGSDHISRAHRISLGLLLKPASRFNISIDPFYYFNKENSQYVETIEIAEKNRYILAQLVQKTFGMVFRLNYSVTPELSVQYYGQPFISAGSYNEYKRVTNPRAKKYHDRFYSFTPDEIAADDENEIYLIDEDQDGETDYSLEYPDFNYKQFRSNLVIRWEYRPGSLLYLVWSQGRTDEDVQGEFFLQRNLRDLFRTPADNVYLLKLNYWFSL